MLARVVFPKIGALAVRRITPAHVLDVLDTAAKNNGPTVAAEAKRAMSGVFDLAASTLRADVDPVYPVRKAPPANKTQHKRPLTAEEIGQFLRDLAGYERNFQTVAGFRCELVWTGAAMDAETVTTRLMSVVDRDKDPKTRSVAAVMLAPFCQKGNSDLVEKLWLGMVARWRQEADSGVKFRLFWNVLDCNAENQIVEELNGWWQDNLRVWVVETWRRFGRAERVLPGVRYRLRQGAKRKTWAYLAQTVVSCDGAGIRALLREHENSAEPFVRPVVEGVREILDNAESVVLRAAADERTRPAR